MARDPAQAFTRGFFSLLAAAFLLLGGFVFLVIGLFTPSPVRLVIALVLLGLGGLLIHGGLSAIRSGGGGSQGEKEPVEAEEPSPGSGASPTRKERGSHGRGSDGPDGEDPLGP